MSNFVQNQVTDHRETPRTAKKISTGRIFPALFFEHDAEFGRGKRACETPKGGTILVSVQK